MSQPIKVGFCSMQNYLDKTAFSGTLFSMHRALQRQGVEVVNLGDPAAPSIWSRSKAWLRKLAYRVGSRPPDQATQERRFLKTVKKAVDRHACDVLFAPVGSREVSLVEAPVPIIFLSDATPVLIKPYNIFADEQDFQRAVAEETAVLKKAARAIYSSDWAAQSAVHDYGADPRNVAVVPFGANVESVPPKAALTARCDSPRCRLVFIGRDWKRKGGQIAYEAFLALEGRGLDVDLHVVGCVPPAEVQHPRIRVTPFLNKNLAKDREAFDQILMESHFLVFPTRADCSPISICEASAYGIPVVATDVGGIPSLIRTGRNGFMFPLSARGDDYAALIAQQFADKTGYRKLVEDCRLEYDTRLNWDAWSRSVRDIMVDAVAEAKRR